MSTSDRPPTTRLGDAAWPTVAAGASPIVIVPVGACEQHGPHLPIGTDTAIASALSDRLATALMASDHRAWVAPPISITASGEHQGFPGTLSIGTEAMRTVVIELVRSATWARAVILVNGHGGNHEAVDSAVSLLTAEGHSVLAWWPTLPADAAAAGDLHAGHVETSIMSALDPDTVDLALAAAGPGSVTLAELRSAGVGAVSPSGVLGDPRRATAADGHALLEALTAQLIRAAGEHLGLSVDLPAPQPAPQPISQPRS